MATHSLPALVRRINRKLEIGRGMHFTNDDLALLVETGAYGALSQALIEQTESKCREQMEHQPPPNQSPWPPEKAKSSRKILHSS